MKITASVIPALVLIVSLTGAGRGQPVAGTLATDTKKNIFSDDSHPIRIKAGEEFSIVLDSNPTTGYSWQLEKSFDKDVLGLIEHGYLPPESPRRGAGGREIWDFRARKEGTAEIRLEYRRPWEKDKLPIRTRTFTVLVSERGQPFTNH